MKKSLLNKLLKSNDKELSMENNKCCYCRETVMNVREGYIGIISFHDRCFKAKYRKSDGKENCEHIKFED